MTHPAPIPPHGAAFFVLNAHIVCTSEVEAKALMVRLQGALEVERRAIVERPDDPTKAVAALSMFVVRLSRAAVRTLLLSLATLAASSPEVETGGTKAAGVIDAIRRSQGAAGN